MGAGVFSAEETATRTNQTASLAFSPSHITQARERVKRVGWDGNVIDAHYPGTQTQARQMWIDTVKTALLGKETRMRSTVNAFNALLDRLNTQPTKTRQGGGMYFLQAYDCLRALPEWNKLESGLRAALHERLRVFIRGNLRGEVEKTDLQSRPEAIQDLSFRLYAHELMKSQGAESNAVNPREAVDTIRQSIIAEGLIGPAVSVDGQAIARHFKAGQDFLLAGAAVKSASPPLYESIEPWLQTVVELTAGLIQQGDFPAVVNGSAAMMADAARVLERGYALWPRPRYGALLKVIYDSRPRQAESLLYGPLSLETIPAYIPSTTAFPQTGFVSLYSQMNALAVSICMDTGLSRYGNSALLSIDVGANEQSLTVPSPGEGTKRYNTVLVDGKNQPKPEPGQAANGLIYSLRNMDGGSAYAQVLAEGRYTERAAYPKEGVNPVSMYRRSVLLHSPVLFDLFRVSGGSEHEYRYSAKGNVISVTNLDAQVADRPVEGLGIYGLTFQSQAQAGVGERVWVIDPAGSQVSVQSHNHGSTLSILRNEMEGQGDLFAVVHEFFTGSVPKNTQVKRLPLKPGTNERDFQAIALVFEGKDSTDIFLSATNPETEYSTSYLGNKLVFQGTWGHVQLKNGEFETMRLGGGKHLRYGVHAVTPREPIVHGYAREIQDRQGYISADFVHKLPEEKAIAGHSILALASYPTAVMYQSLVLNSISVLQSPQHFVMKTAPNFGNTPPELGFRFQSGDTLLYESFVELHRVDENHYTLVLNTPSKVMVEGSNTWNRIIYGSAKYGKKRVVGEYRVGVIQASFEPAEAYKGKIEFQRLGGMPFKKPNVKRR
ncbi:hypothetical protein GF373_01100 [bacterium]|nr:hypothetical protein [bacterium]